jgi:GT2 family glycosyltransferase
VSEHDGMATVTVVLVAYGTELLLPTAVDAVLASTGIGVEVIVVDNGCTDGGVDAVESRAGVTVLRPGRNIGFDAACNLGAGRGHGEFLALVNQDAIAAPDALERLRAVAADPTVGIATASLRLAAEPDLMNSAGNEIHFLGFSWCGGYRDPGARHTTTRDVASASGAAMVMRRALWTELGGFPSEFFMYYEDPELSLRCWRRGLRVVFVPDAVVTHEYERHEAPEKMYYAERNRLVALLTLYDARTLVLLLPAGLAVEIAMLVLAARRGWAREKARGWWWIARHRRWIRARRRQLTAERTTGDRAVARVLSTRLLESNLELPSALAPLDRALAVYWSVVRRLLR